MTGKEITEIRTRFGLTPRELGDLIGASQSSVYRWEAHGMRSSSQNPFAARLLILMAAFSQAHAEQLGSRLRGAFVISGSLYALHVLLTFVFQEDPPDLN